MRSSREDSLGPPAHPAAVVVLLALVGATLGAVIHYRPDASRSVPPPTARVASAEPIVEPTGTALVDAIPWGRIESVISADGRLFENPAQRDTPLVLELPEGAWRIVLSHPETEEEQVCELTIAEGVRDDCLIEFERLTVDQYFREAGWWR